MPLIQPMRRPAGTGQQDPARQPMIPSATRLSCGTIRCQINGGPGLLLTAGDRAYAAMTWEISAGQVTAIHLITNPDKLAAISVGRTLLI